MNVCKRESILEPFCLIKFAYIKKIHYLCSKFKKFIIMRIKKETLEKVDELKELILKLDNQRVDFYNEDECEYMWNGEELDHGDLNIFNGSAWYYDDEVHVTSIYVEKDKLYFDANWDAYNYKGNNCGDEVMNHLDAEFIVGRYWEESQEKAFIETLEFFISLLKQ